jgi:hypothetical protein
MRRRDVARRPSAAFSGGTHEKSDGGRRDAAIVSTPVTLGAQGNRWRANYFHNAPVVTQDGKTLKFHHEVIDGFGNASGGNDEDQ